MLYRRRKLLTLRIRTLVIQGKKNSEYTWRLIDGKLVQWKVDGMETFFEELVVQDTLNSHEIIVTMSDSVSFLTISKKAKNLNYGTQWIVWEDIVNELICKVGLLKRWICC